MRIQQKSVNLNYNVTAGHYSVSIPSYSKLIDIDMNFHSSMLIVYYLADDEFNDNQKIINIGIYQNNNNIANDYYTFFKIIKREEIRVLQLPSNNISNHQTININANFQIVNNTIGEYFIFIDEVLPIGELREKKLNDIL